MKDYTKKISSGSLRDKTTPTRKRWKKVPPAVIATALDVYKKSNDKMFKDKGFKLYDNQFMQNVRNTLVKNYRKGILTR